VRWYSKPNYAIASKAFKDSHKMNLSALAWIERDNKIKDNRIGCA
jgi:hypothetical protein